MQPRIGYLKDVFGYVFFVVCWKRFFFYSEGYSVRVLDLDITRDALLNIC